jgi:cellulose synthase/poly-beta-1,6-N-acetylglucosamine synthase-like glycosyltransferase
VILDILAWVAAAAPLLLLAILILELALGTLVRSRARPAPGNTRPNAVILMPAHDEAGGIAATLARLRPALDEHIRLIVIADNCSDDTAAIARAAGAHVLERNDATRRGKGHALAFGRDALRDGSQSDGLPGQPPPDCLVILDADCDIGRDDLRLLIDTACKTGRPVQSRYLLRTLPGASAMTQISNFAFLIKNLVRARANAWLKAPAMLGGTGMAFPWALAEHAPLATSHLVEDLVLGIAFARAGHAPIFLEQATTWSDPASQQDTRTQRTRWEHGYIDTALKHGLPLVLAGLSKARPALFWHGLSLLVPPLALLVSLSLLTFAGTTALALLGATPMPATMLAAALMLAGIWLILAWYRDGRETVRLATLARIPLYLLWKIPVYLRLIGKRERNWVRTRRDGED